MAPLPGLQQCPKHPLLDRSGKYMNLGEWEEASSPQVTCFTFRDSIQSLRSKQSSQQDKMNAVAD